MSTKTPGTADDSTLTDDQLLVKARAAQNGRKFALRFDSRYDSGVLSREYDSLEQAGSALLFNLCWWTNGDREQAKRLFKQSAVGSEFAETDLIESRLDELVTRVVEELDGDGYDPSELGDGTDVTTEDER